MMDRGVVCSVLTCRDAAQGGGVLGFDMLAKRFGGPGVRVERWWAASSMGSM